MTQGNRVLSVLACLCAALAVVTQAGAPEDTDMLLFVSESLPRHIVLRPSVKFVEMTFRIPTHAMSFGVPGVEYGVEDNIEGVPETLVDNTTQAALYFVVQQWVNTSGTQKDKEDNSPAAAGYWADVGYIYAVNFTDKGIEREFSKNIGSAIQFELPSFNSTSSSSSSVEGSSIEGSGSSSESMLSEEGEGRNKEFPRQRGGNGTVAFVQDAMHRIELRTNVTTPVVVKMGIVTLGSYGGMQTWLGLAVMVVTYGLIATEIVEKALMGLAAMFVTMLLLLIGNKEYSLEFVAQWLDQSTFVLLFGMMIIVKIFGDTGFFEWVSVLCIRISKGSVRMLFVLICTITAFFSAFLDNVTTVLLSSPITINVCELLDISPVPFLIGQALASNIGGTATLIGDPPNIIIGSMLKEHVDFLAFIVNLMPFVVVAFVIALVFMMVWWRHSIAGRRQIEMQDLLQEGKIHDRPKFIKCCVVLCAVLLFFFLSSVLSIEPAWIALAGATILMMLTYPRHIDTPLSGVEWSTLVFFAALFVLINGMAKLGIIRVIGSLIASILEAVPPSGQLYAAMTLILWFSAFLSAIISSIPTTTTFVPVLKELVANPALHLRMRPLIWALSIGACFGGNGTLIGAPANVVVAGIVRSKGYFITFMKFLKVGTPVMLITVALANVYLLIFYGALHIDA